MLISSEESAEKLPSMEDSFVFARMTA